VIQERIADGKASFDVCNVRNANADPASFAVNWVLFEKSHPRALLGPVRARSEGLVDTVKWWPTRPPVSFS
jgi:hypothetical protein